MIQVGDCLDLSELYDENNEWVVQPGRTLSRAGQVYELVGNPDVQPGDVVLSSRMFPGEDPDDVRRVSSLVIGRFYGVSRYRPSCDSQVVLEMGITHSSVPHQWVLGLSLKSE